MRLDYFKNLVAAEVFQFATAFPQNRYLSRGLRVQLKNEHYLPDSVERDLAWCEFTPEIATIYVMDRLLSYPAENIVGVLRHELGHIVDPVIAESGAEQRADNLAEVATGCRIYYDANDVQTIAIGKYPRPKYLHR